MALHGTQEAILGYIKQNPDITVRELQKKCDISTPSLVQHHLQRLQIGGYIRKGDKWEIVEK